MKSDITIESCIIKFSQTTDRGTRTSIKIFCPNDGGPSRTGTRLATFLRRREHDRDNDDVICSTPPPDNDHVYETARDYLSSLECTTEEINTPFMLDGHRTSPERHTIDMFYKITISQDGMVYRIEVTANRVDKRVYEDQKKIWDNDFAMELAVKSMLVFGGSLKEFARFVRVM